MIGTQRIRFGEAWDGYVPPQPPRDLDANGRPTKPEQFYEHEFLPDNFTRLNPAEQKLSLLTEPFAVVDGMALRGLDILKAINEVAIEQSNRTKAMWLGGLRRWWNPILGSHGTTVEHLTQKVLMNDTQPWLRQPGRAEANLAMRLHNLDYQAGLVEKTMFRLRGNVYPDMEFHWQLTEAGKAMLKKMGLA